MTNLIRIWPRSAAMYEVAQSQDAIGWTEFLHGKVLTKMRGMQQAHCLLTNTNLNGDNWMVELTRKLINLTLTMALQKLHSPPSHKGLPMKKNSTRDPMRGGQIGAHKQPRCP
jgi:hypothetical protein